MTYQILRVLSRDADPRIFECGVIESDRFRKLIAQGIGTLEQVSRSEISDDDYGYIQPVR